MGVGEFFKNKNIKLLKLLKLINWWKINKKLTVGAEIFKI